MTLVITVLHDLCHHNAVYSFSSQFPKTTLITMLADHFHPISLLSLQFPMDPSFTMLHDACHHSAPWLLLSQCSRTSFITILHPLCHHLAQWNLSLQCSMTLVITMLHGTCHNNAPEFLSSQCSMTMSSQWSMALVSTMLQNSFFFFFNIIPFIWDTYSSQIHRDGK